MKRFIIIFLVLTIGTMGLTGCASMTKSEQGAAIGAGAGAVIGGIIGHQTGNKEAGIFLGALIGGAVGAYIGNYMDKQAQEIAQEVPDAEVVVIDHEGKPAAESGNEGQAIHMTFNSATLFDVDQFDIKMAGKENLTSLANILNKYPDTNVEVQGHTDSSGSEAYNQTLSDKRANAVVNYLAANGIKRSRMTAIGFGENHPIASNDTPEGKQQNRRVDLLITPNDQLIQTAKAETGGN